MTEPERRVMSALPTGKADNTFLRPVGFFIVTRRSEPIKANPRKIFLSGKGVVSGMVNKAKKALSVDIRAKRKKRSMQALDLCGILYVHELMYVQNATQIRLLGEYP